MESDDRKYDRSRLLHEMGHHVVCYGLGYDSIIDINPDTSEYSLKHSIPNNTEKGLEENIVVAFGGLMAEKLFGITGESSFDDLRQIRDMLKDLYTLQNKDFQWDNKPVPATEYGPFIKRTISILNEAGGREGLDCLVNIMLNDWKEMPNKWKVPETT